MKNASVSEVFRNPLKPKSDQMSPCKTYGNVKQKSLEHFYEALEETPLEIKGLLFLQRIPNGSETQ